MQRTQHVDELLAQPVLERHPLAHHPAWDQHHLLVLDVDALELADPLREPEHLRLRERRGGVEAAPALPHQRRVQALLDRRPDRERGREVIALDDQVGAVAHADFTDSREQLIRGVAGKHVRQAGLNAHTHERQQPGLLPGLVLGELVLSQQRPRAFVGPAGVGPRGRQRHVQVGDPGLERGAEDGHVQAGIARVQDRVGRHPADQRHHVGGVGGVDALGREAPRLAEARHDRPHALGGDVREHHPLERRPALGDRGEGRSDTTGSHDQDLHQACSVTKSGRIRAG